MARARAAAAAARKREAERQQAAADAPPRATPAPAAPNVSNAAQRLKVASTVTVACKIPNGLELRLFKRDDYEEETPSGTRTRKRFVQDPDAPTHTVRGPAVPVGQKPKGYRTPQRVAGYALTPNIPADFFDEWMRQNAKNPIVTSKLIWAESRQAEVIQWAREHKDTRSGFEPMVPDTDPRMPKSLNAGVTQIRTADEMKDREALPEVEED